MGTWKLFYDGGCDLCHRSKLTAEGWAKRANQSLELDLLASEEAIAKGYGAVMILEVDGQPLAGPEAWLQLMTLAPWYLRWISLARLTKPTHATAKLAYSIVEKNRRRWFAPRGCHLPTA